MTRKEYVAILVGIAIQDLSLHLNSKIDLDFEIEMANKIADALERKPGLAPWIKG